MNHFFLSGDERLEEWSLLRDEGMTPDMSDEEQLSCVAKWWSKCPLSNRTIDPYDSSDWPTPWELLHSGDICRSSLALCMMQTLLAREGRWSSHNLKLQLIDDSGEDIFIIVNVDDTFILNYDINNVVGINEINHPKILAEFRYDEHYGYIQNF